MQNHKYMKILIVDDQELVLLSLEKCLTDLGYEVKCSNNVFDGIATYDEFLQIGRAHV